jgi:hypothetical protein
LVSLSLSLSSCLFHYEEGFVCAVYCVLLLSLLLLLLLNDPTLLCLLSYTHKHTYCSAFFNRPLTPHTNERAGKLVSGANAAIDVDDMRAHTVYAGGYSDMHPVIINFWAIVHEMADADRRALIKFITSCERAPLLGFKELVPQLCIRPGGEGEGWLPTASTCINLLKLPAYEHRDTLREKLLMSIRSGAGFDLS